MINIEVMRNSRMHSNNFVYTE